MHTIDNYGYAIELAEALPAARERVIAALKAQGFGVLTEVDVQATLREKLGAETPPYRILGVCNPPLAHRALSISAHAGLMLPCTVTLREQGGRTIVELLRPEAAVSVIAVDALQPVASEAEARLRAVVEALEATAARD